MTTTATTTGITGAGLVPRNFDRDGRLQMAEGRLDGHTPDGTPVDNMFLVHHYAQPSLPVEATLTIAGPDGRVATVDRRVLETLPVHTVTAVLECAGNGRGLLAKRSPGNQFGLGLFAQSKWTGARVADVLAAAGMPADGWETLVASAPDSGVTAPENIDANFAKGLPRTKALHPDTLLAWDLNGSPIPANHGGPLRLVVPGWYGIWWVKWPTRIELTQELFDGFWQNQRYTYQDPDGNVVAVVEDQLPRVVIMSPTEGQLTTDDTTVELHAWAGEHTVDLVEVSVDDGATWLPARRIGEDGPWAWQQWTVDLPPGLPRGLCRLAARAVDSAGRTQDWQPAPNRLGYGNNGIHIVQINLIAKAPQ